MWIRYLRIIVLFTYFDIQPTNKYPATSLQIFQKKKKKNTDSLL